MQRCLGGDNNGACIALLDAPRARRPEGPWSGRHAVYHDEAAAIGSSRVGVTVLDGSLSTRTSGSQASSRRACVCRADVSAIAVDDSVHGV